MSFSDRVEKFFVGIQAGLGVFYLLIAFSAHLLFFGFLLWFAWGAANQDDGFSFWIFLIVLAVGGVFYSKVQEHFPLPDIEKGQRRRKR